MSTRLMRALTRGLLAAMLLAVLAPAISRARASVRVAGEWVELCSAQGMRWVQLAVEEDQTAEPGAVGDWRHALDVCGHCALAAEHFAALVPALPVWYPTQTVGGVPPHQAALHPALNAPSPGARDPPLLS